MLTVPGGGSLTTPLTVDVVDAGGGSATSPGDYAFAMQTVTFPIDSIGGAAQSVNLTVMDDDRVEGSESLNLTLTNVSSPGVIAAPSDHAVTILDDESAQIRFQSASSSTPEANSPFNVFLELVTDPGVTLAPGVSITVDAQDAGGGSATSGSDYDSFGIQIATFGPGATGGDTRPVTIQVLDDLNVEGTETIDIELVSLSLSSATLDVTIGSPALHAVSVVDNDKATVAFASASSSIGEVAGSHAIDVVLSIAGGGMLERTVSVGVADLGTGSADDPADYSFAAQTVTFPAGSASGATQSVTMSIVGDPDPESDETIDLALINVVDNTGDDVIHAGNGRNRVWSGSGNDILVGGAGDDLLIGGEGRDFLIGGIGADRLVGNQGEDLLIAGYTAHDNNTAALLAIMSEWTSGNNYNTRVTNITNGTGLTAGNRLVGDDGASQTVFNDTDVDILTGSQGQDWFFANRVADNGGPLDCITDKAANELWNDTDF